jgi:hypothetical protein|tara:strand:- start:243 stop:416 length:174 start_codon:yes stop_codon:yes gene_type:complete
MLFLLNGQVSCLICAEGTKFSFGDTLFGIRKAERGDESELLLVNQVIETSVPLLDST